MALTKALGGSGGGGGITQLTGDVTAGPGSGSQAATLAEGAVDIAHLSATGTPDGTTFLRGDNTWSAPSGGGGGALVFLGAVTASAAAAADFTSLINSTYDDYELVFEGVTVGTNNAEVFIQLSANNGSAWITSGYQSGRAIYGLSTNFSNYVRNATQAGLSLAGAAWSSTLVSAGVSRLFRANTSERKSCITDALLGAGDSNTYRVACGAEYTSATTFNAIRIIASAGTITGTFRLYGRAKV